MERKRPKDVSETWSSRVPVRLFLDDIQAMLNILGRLDGLVARCETKELSNITAASELEGVQAADLDGFEMFAAAPEQEDDERKPRFAWEKRASACLITLPMKRTVFVSDREPVSVRIETSDDLGQKGALQELTEVLKSARRRVPRAWQPYALWFLFFVAWGLAALVRNVDAVVWVVLSAWVLLAIAWLAVLYLRWRTPPVQIVTTWRKDAPSFFNRNRDALIVNLLTTVFGVVLGFILGRVI